MPVDFTDLLRSLRSDGKLIISNAIRAAAGKKVVQDVRDSTNQVEIDLEDETGAITTATIAKGAAVDGTARQSIEDHEDATNPHSIEFSDLSGMIADSQIPATIARDSEITAAIDALALSAISGTLTASQLPSEAMLDSEFTAAAVRGLLGFTATEVNDILVGATVSGIGANRVITIPQNDGTSLSLAVPDTTGGGGMGADGVVASGAFSDDQTELVLTLDTGSTVTIDVPEELRRGLQVVSVGADGRLPAAADNIGKVGLAGNHFYRSVGEQGTDKVVTFKNYSATRTVLTGEPARSGDELLYAGSFANPPVGNYTLNAWAWDRGSEVWIRNLVHNGASWVSSSGPLAYHHGNLYQTESDAAVHVPNATYEGRVYIIGHGSSQRPKIITGYTAPTAPSAEWIPIGLTIQDIADQIAVHDGSGTAHGSIRSDISAVEDRLDAIDVRDIVEIAAYESDATYSRGSANSIVTHSSGLFIYISSTTRSSNHDPDTQPGYWLKLSEGVAYEVITSGSHRIAARTLIVDGATDQVYLCTTTQTMPRDLTYIKAQADIIGGTFIELTAMIPTTWKGPHIIGQDYEAGDRVTTNANSRIYTARVDTDETPPHADWIQVGPVSSGGFTLRQGTTAPGNSLGDDDDWYLRTSNGQWYEKVSGAWESRYTDQVGQAGSGITQTQGDARYALQSENLSDLDDAATARTNLGLGTAAVQPANAFLTIDSGDSQYLNEAQNLSDLPNADTARTNLGLGTAATRDTGTSENNVPILDSSGDVDPTIVPIDNTLQVDGSGDIGVNTQRVVQEVSEWVQHFATGDSHDTSGHSGKYQEYTSPNTHRRIGSVQYDFDPENDSGGGGTGKTYQVFILELTGRNIDVVLGSSEVYSGNSLQHRFHFTDGVMINPNVHIGIGLHRTDGGNNEGLSVRAGAESQDSPRESYDDASNDFNFVGRFNHDRPTPSVNDTVGGTAANQIYGNPEIFYQIIHTHDSLVGDGNVSAAHISSGSAAADEVLKADGAGGGAFGAVVVHGEQYRRQHDPDSEVRQRYRDGG